eukprot:m.31844 g.31844  ORF g.31844 m.31844 type:complete len:333 (-) comp9735_c0_seq1:228-1226(-)
MFKKKKTTMTKRRVRFHVVRHGERLDEVPFNDWYSTHPENKILYDPPLTEMGKMQARDVVTLYLKHKNIKATTMYTSRMSRCVSTAIELAVALGIPEIRPSRGLAECAAAIRERTAELSKFLSDGELEGLTEGRVVLGESLDLEIIQSYIDKQLQHLSTSDDVDDNGDDDDDSNDSNEQGDGEEERETRGVAVTDRKSTGLWTNEEETGFPPLTFRSSLVHLCERHAEDGEFILCSHREGLRDLLRYCGLNALRFGYCATAQFEYDFEDDKFYLVDHCESLIQFQQMPRASIPSAFNKRNKTSKEKDGAKKNDSSDSSKKGGIHKAILLFSK